MGDFPIMKNKFILCSQLRLEPLVSYQKDFKKEGKSFLIFKNTKRRVLNTMIYIMKKHDLKEEFKVCY